MVWIPRNVVCRWRSGGEISVTVTGFVRSMRRRDGAKYVHLSVSVSWLFCGNAVCQGCCVFVGELGEGVEVSLAIRAQICEGCVNKILSAVNRATLVYW